MTHRLLAGRKLSPTQGICLEGVQASRGPERRARNTLARFIAAWAGLSACAWLILVCPAACAAPQAQPSRELINTCGALQALSPAEAVLGLPVQIRGIVMCYDEGWRQFSLNDSATCMYMDPSSLPQKFQNGQVIELKGKTCLIDGQTRLTNIEVTTFATNALPTAKRVRLSETGKLSGAWVEITGIVRIAETSRARLGLLLQDGNERVVVHVMGNSGAQDSRKLLGSTVRVKAISSARPINNSLDANSLICPSLNEMVIVSPPKSDPMAMKPMPLESILSRPLGSWTNEWIHVQATVSASVPGEYIMLKGGRNALRANVLQLTSVSPGQRVAAWGFIRSKSDGPVLDDTFFEPFYVHAPVAQPGIGSTNFPSHADGTNLSTLTSVVSMMTLSREQLLQRIPVRFQGVITYSDPRYFNHYFQDSTDAIYIECQQTNLQPGQYVEVTGYSDPGGFMPQVVKGEVKVLGTTNMPTPIHADMRDVAAGQLDCHFLQMEGIVRRAVVEDGHLRLTVTSKVGRFYVILPDYWDDAGAAKLVDARVAATGTCTSLMNPDGQLTGVVINVPRPEYLRRLDGNSGDPFDGLATTIRSVARFNPNNSAGHRVKISGAVTYTSAEGLLYVQDATGAIEIHSDNSHQSQVGDEVEVLGFPVLGDCSPILEDVVVRKTGAKTTVSPAVLTAEQILTNTWADARFIELDAQVMQDVPHSLRPRMLLQEGSTLFTAELSSFCPPHAIAGLRSGTLVRVRGVCSMRAVEVGRPESFKLLIAQPSHVQVLKSPPLLSSGKLLAIAAVLAFAVMAALAWIRMLRRRVRSQTEVIRQKLEERQEFAEKLAREKQLLTTLIDHMPDHVFARDTQGRFLLGNQKYAQFHGIADVHNIAGRSLSECFPDKLAAKRQATDEQIFTGSAACLQEEEPLKNAAGEDRWVHTIRVPLMDSYGAIMGLVGISRDITDRKRAEAELDRMHHQLIDTSRQAGMAEVATSVLHNVGNVLNSVNVSVSVISEQVRSSRTKKVADVAALLNQNLANIGSYFGEDPKGKQLPTYISNLAEHLETERKSMLDEMQSLSRNVEHIKDIVAMQQNYAKVRGVVETVHVSELLEDALRINAGALERHGLAIDRQYDVAQLPCITVEKHKVLQILVNLIRNAKYACDDSGRQDKLLTLKASHEQGRVRISVQDNGVGIPRENITRIFNHGFTTRKTGHGFGLHSGALAAKELSGTLSVTSDGPGKGATFTLDLPADTTSV